MKKVKLLLSFILCMFLLSCGSKSDKKEITVYINATDQSVNYLALKELATKFEAENEGIKVDVQAGSSSYEPTMKTRMASNDLPDIFATHGWSVMRYIEYLEPLDNLSFYNDIHPLIKPVIQDKEGHVYVLPLNMDIVGIVYNEDVLNDLGYKVSDLKYYDKFKEVLAKASEKGYIPIHMGAKDASEAAHIYDWLGSAFIITPEKNEADNLLKGVFNTEPWTVLTQEMLDMKQYLNTDFVTATNAESASLMANNKVLFTLAANGLIKEAKQYNPDAKIGFMPSPAYDKNDEPTLISGEGDALGVWKDSPNKEEAIKFIEFLARPENIKFFAEKTGAPAGLSTVSADLGELSKYYEEYKDVKIVPYLDRAYLPSGMWSTLCDVSLGVLTGQFDVQKGVEVLKTDFEKLYNAQNK